jgi:two-component system, cell cycle response regulator
MERSPQEIRVLVVDDSPISRKLLEYALTKNSYKVLFAKEGREAMQLFTEHPADLVITDWEMADISGPELCRKIRSEFPAAYTYLLLLTSNSDKKSLADGLAAGADDYLTKPFDQDELRARVGVGRRVIEMHREIEAKNMRLALDARTDPLTGLPNRRAVEEWAVKQVAGAARHGYSIWVVLADLDSLKQVNDTFGHAAGDKMLQAFAEILNENTRVSDLCGHFGGEQFIMVLSHVEKGNIQFVIDRLRKKIAARPFTFKGAATALTVSFGVACSEDCKPLELRALLRQADDALLDAKRTAQCLVGTGQSHTSEMGPDPNVQ